MFSWLDFVLCTCWRRYTNALPYCSMMDRAAAALKIWMFLLDNLYTCTLIGVERAPVFLGCVQQSYVLATHTSVLLDGERAQSGQHVLQHGWALRRAPGRGWFPVCDIRVPRDVWLCGTCDWMRDSFGLEMITARRPGLVPSFQYLCAGHSPRTLRLLLTAPKLACFHFHWKHHRL